MNWGLKRLTHWNLCSWTPKKHQMKPLFLGTWLTNIVGNCLVTHYKQWVRGSSRNCHLIIIYYSLYLQSHQRMMNLTIMIITIERGLEFFGPTTNIIGHRRVKSSANKSPRGNHMLVRGYLFQPQHLFETEERSGIWSHFNVQCDLSYGYHAFLSSGLSLNPDRNGIKTCPSNLLTNLNGTLGTIIPAMLNFIGV